MAVGGWKMMGDIIKAGLDKQYEQDLMKWMERSDEKTSSLTYEMLRKKEIELRRRYFEEPVLNPSAGDYNWYTVTGTTVLTRSASEVLMDVYDPLEKATPNPRDELEQRCKDKGLDPAFARELDLD